MTDKQIDKHIPRLRFHEFQNDDEWTEKKFGDCLEYEQPQQYLVSSDNYKRTGTPVLTAGKTFVLGYTDEITGIYNHLPVIIFDDFTTACKFVDFPFKAKSSAMKMLQNRSGYDLRFMFEAIQNYKFEPKDHQRHWINIFSQFKILVPSYSEQQKIASCLSSIDSYISSINEKKEQLKAHKKSLMQKLFPQNGQTVPEYRFSEFEKDVMWNFVKGSELFEPIVNKKHNSDLPILAITQDQGAVPRGMIDYNVIASEKSIANYKVVEIGDFIISLRSFQGGIEYSNYEGLCSPAYIVLRKKNDTIFNGFYRHYFKSIQFIRDLNQNLEGIRDGKMVSYQQFSQILIPYPPYEEQHIISDCLSSIDKTIKVYSDKVYVMEQYKRGLMEQLFPRP